MLIKFMKVLVEDIPVTVLQCTAIDNVFVPYRRCEIQRVRDLSNRICAFELFCTISRPLNVADILPGIVEVEGALPSGYAIIRGNRVAAHLFGSLIRGICRPRTKTCRDPREAGAD